MSMPLDPEVLHFVLTVGLSQEDLLELLHGLGISFPGVRPSQLTKSELADALADEFSKNQAVHLKVAQVLDQKLPRRIPDASQLAGRLPAGKAGAGWRAFRRALREAGPPELAAYLWWFSKEETPEAKRGYEAALDVLDQRMEDLEKAATAKALADVFERSDKAAELEKSLEEARQSERQKERRMSELTNQLDEIQKRLRQKDVELSQSAERMRQMQAALKEKEGLQAAADEREKLGGEMARAQAEAADLRLELSQAKEKLDRYGNLKRIGLFVDFHNLLCTSREAYGGLPDFKALRAVVEGGPESAERLVVEAYAYLAEDPMQEKENWKALLRQAGFTIRTRPIVFRADGTAKGDWDLGIAVEVLERSDRLDIVILGTGDSDFLDLVQHLKEKKPHLQVEIACFDSPRHTSERLLHAADRVHLLGPRHLLAAPQPS